MNCKAIAITAALAGLIAPAPASAQGAYSLRNDSGLTLNCRLDRPHSTAGDRFALRQGEEWSRPAQSGAARMLACDTGTGWLRASLRPGPLYALVLDRRTGRIALRIAPRG